MVASSKDKNIEFSFFGNINSVQPTKENGIDAIQKTCNSLRLDEDQILTLRKLDSSEETLFSLSLKISESSNETNVLSNIAKIVKEEENGHLVYITKNSAFCATTPAPPAAKTPSE